MLQDLTIIVFRKGNMFLLRQWIKLTEKLNVAHDPWAIWFEGLATFKCIICGFHWSNG